MPREDFKLEQRCSYRRHLSPILLRHTFHPECNARVEPILLRTTLPTQTRRARPKFSKFPATAVYPSSTSAPLAPETPAASAMRNGTSDNPPADLQSALPSNNNTSTGEHRIGALPLIAPPVIETTSFVQIELASGLKHDQLEKIKVLHCFF